MERQQRRRRRRPALSCLECRRRKIKCDRSEPCAHCVSAKIRCVFRVYRDEPIDGQSTTTPSPPGRAASPSPAQKISAREPTGESGQSPPRQPAAVASGIPEADIRNLLQQIQRLRASTPSKPLRSSDETNRDPAERQSSLQASQIVMNKTRLLRWSHLMGNAKELRTCYECFSEAVGGGGGVLFQSDETKALTAEMGDLLQQCKVLARQSKIGRPSRSLGGQGYIPAPPPREEADAMAALYFQSFESAYRILHIPTFWSEYQLYWSQPESAPIEIRLKVLLVIAIGLSLRKHSDEDAPFRTAVHRWVYAAQTWLSGPLEKSRLEIAGLQIHCLALIARQAFSIGADLAWASMGSLIHQAMQMGLHRDPKHLPAMSVLQAELRRRLWATIIEMAVQSSLDSALPPRISLDEFDTLAPSNVDDEELNTSATILQPHDRNTYTATSVQLILLDSLPIRLRILKLLTSLRSELSYTDVLALSSELSSACRSCSAFMGANAVSGVTPFHRNMLDYLVRRFMIPLHSSFANQARENPFFHYSLKATLDAAMAIVSPEPDESFANLMMIGGGMFREAIRYAGTIITIELLAEVESQRLDGTLQRSSQRREHLKQTVVDLMSQSEERMRLGETNIKMHTFLAMVLAQVKAAETGDPDYELKMARDARDSLARCYSLLQGYLGSLSPPSAQSDAGLASRGSVVREEGIGFGLDLDFLLPEADFSWSPEGWHGL
ncbi:hypothetical protein GQ53DRAFT_731238 [Thozetella sp. PMI_491]|nr:hypothetical protein GQ53DRAFT_731238 [Thozetella sp. PMI_491]